MPFAQSLETSVHTANSMHLRLYCIRTETLLVSETAKCYMEVKVMQKGAVEDGKETGGREMESEERGKLWLVGERLKPNSE
jgi:hypothetical protein